MPDSFILRGDSARMQINENSFDLPIAKSTEGPDGILISQIRNDNFVTLDPGFLTTAQCESAITYIDGNNSILRYRGYPIEQLAESSNFVETTYLLVNGELPNSNQYEEFLKELHSRTLINEKFRSLLSSFPKNSHPMSMLASAISAMEAFYPKTSNPKDPNQLSESAFNILSKTRTIISFIYRELNDLPLIYPNSAHGFVDDFLRMCFTKPYEEFQANPTFISALDRSLILHADHEQNCSTTSVRITGSANASLYAAVSSGISALSGPKHGGANEEALKQLKAIKKFKVESKGSVKDFVENAKSKNKRIAGLGHRVYKSYDPRAKVAKSWVERIYREGQGRLDLFETALELEEIALTDEYFLERGLYPNVDFWTGLIYRAIGFNSKMFTALFALGRIPGWISQYIEMQNDPNSKIGRPRQVYIGQGLREYVNFENRKSIDNKGIL